MPTKSTRRNTRATQAALEDPKAGRMDHSKDPNAEAQLTKTQRIDAPSLNPKVTYTNPSSGDQQVVPQPALAPAEGQPTPAVAAATNTQHTPLEPQKSQEACCFTDDDDHTRADDDQHAAECQEGDKKEQQQLQLLQRKLQQEQEDEDAAAAVAAAAALTAAAAERAGQLSGEEDDEDEDPSVPKPRTGSEIGAEAMDSIIEDFREGAVQQRIKRKAAHDAGAAATVSEPNNSGATITSGGGGGNGRNHPSKRAKRDTGANSRHKSNLDIKNTAAVGGIKNGGLFVHKNKYLRKDEQPSNGGGSGEGSNEPSGSQMAAMGGAAMDNGSDESGEECKSAQQPLFVKRKFEGEGREEDGEDLEDTRSEDKSPRRRHRGDELRVKEEKTQQQLEHQGNRKGRGGSTAEGTAHNKVIFAQDTWPLMPPPPVVRSQPQQQPSTRNGPGRIQQQQANNNATAIGPAPADLKRCASSLGSMHSFYTNVQQHFMAQMQEIMAVAMNHRTHAAVAALTNGTVRGGGGGVGDGKTSVDILPAEDVTAISRACATALSIINNVGAAPGPAAAAAAALFADGGGAGVGDGSAAGTTGLMPPPPPPVSVAPAAATAFPPQVLHNATTLPLPLPLYAPVPGAASAPPHPLQRQLSSGMDLALLHAAPAAATGVNNANAGATNTAMLPDNAGAGAGIAVGGNNNGSNKNIRKLGSLPPMVPVVGGAGLIDSTAFPDGLPVATMQMANFPLQVQTAAATGQIKP